MNKKKLVTTIVKTIPSSISSTKQGTVRLRIFAKPGAKKSAITEMSDDAISVQIAAPPRDGEANQALVEFISSVLGVKKSRVNLELGGKSRSKTLSVETDETTEYIFEKLKNYMED